MVEPMEETRSEITFATELILSSLAGSLGSARSGGVLEGVDLDEVEVSFYFLSSQSDSLIDACDCEKHRSKKGFFKSPMACLSCTPKQRSFTKTSLLKLSSSTLKETGSSERWAGQTHFPTKEALRENGSSPNGTTGCQKVFRKNGIIWVRSFHFVHLSTRKLI